MKKDRKNMNIETKDDKPFASNRIDPKRFRSYSVRGTNPEYWSTHVEWDGMEISILDAIDLFQEMVTGEQMFSTRDRAGRLITRVAEAIVNGKKED